MTQNFDNKYFSWDLLWRVVVTFLIYILNTLIISLFIAGLMSIADPAVSFFSEAARITLDFILDYGTLSAIIVLFLVLVPKSFNKYTLTDECFYIKEYGLFGKRVDMAIELNHISKVELDKRTFWDFYLQKRIIIYMGGTRLRIDSLTHRKDLYIALCNRINH